MPSVLQAVTDKSSVITSPTNGSQLTSTSATFRWKNTGASEYFLYIGTYRGASNLYGTNTSKTVTNLPSNGRKVYVRLFTHSNGWKYNDYVYTSYLDI